jgi:hypothetical protein
MPTITSKPLHEVQYETTSYEVDPLLCPFCGAEMKILAFIVDFATAKAIRKSLGLPAQESEPLAHDPPRALELLDQTA